jgi:hypothetical protein
MTFSKSNLNLLPESLFTELTADQAQMLEGGKRITILQVRCIQATNGSDKLSFTVNGEDLMFGRTIDMRTGGVANVGVAANFFDGKAKVLLFDKDNSSSSRIGGFHAFDNGTKTRLVGSNGSKYEVTYQITN